MRSEIFNMEKIFGFCEKLCYFLVINLFFLLFNIPVLLFFLFVGFSEISTYLPLFMVCMLPLPPAFAAVLYAMGRLERGTESGAVRDYMKGYRTDFWQKFRLGAIQLFFIFLFWTDIRFFSKQVRILPLTLFFVVLFVFSIIITPNLYLLASRYEMSNKQIFKDACILTVTRPICTLGCTAALGIVLMLFELTAGTTVLFMISVYGFLVVFISKNMLKTLEEK